MPDDLPDLDEPAAVWPGRPRPTDEPPAAPQRWVWTAMEPAERRAKLRQLATWVKWLITAHELHNTIPACWYRHPRLLERLTALYTGWVRVYCSPDSERHLAEADWITTLDNMEPRLKVPTCASRHNLPPQLNGGTVSTPTGAEPTYDPLEEFLLTSDWGTRPPTHPAAEEALRLIFTEPPL
ncbi:hypothetical protein ACWY4P_22855 [Streptomyces sp. LZ34]